MYLPTARQMWLDIHDQFKQSDGPRTAEIKQQIFGEIQGSQSVSDYYTKLKQLLRSKIIMRVLTSVVVVALHVIVSSGLWIEKSKITS